MVMTRISAPNINTNDANVTLQPEEKLKLHSKIQE